MKVMATPRRVDVEITSRCNLRCRYCYYFDNEDVDYRDLPTETIGDFLADMEVTARQADADSDIGSFISALADWQTTAEASRNDW